MNPRPFAFVFLAVTAGIIWTVLVTQTQPLSTSPDRVPLQSECSGPAPLGVSPLGIEATTDVKRDLGDKVVLGGVARAAEPALLPDAASVPGRPPGGIAGVVLGPSGRIPGVLVRLRRVALVERMYSASVELDTDVLLLTRPDGTFSCDSLVPGHWTAVVSARAMTPKVVPFQVEVTGGAGEQWCFGDGVVQGTVFGVDGRPSSGVPVQLRSHSAELESTSAFFELKTDETGSFRFDGIPGGSWRLIEVPAGEHERGLIRSKLVSVSSNSTLRRQDLGDSRPWPWWRGVVRNQSGTPIQGPGKMQLAVVESDEVAKAPIGEQGTFSAQFPITECQTVGITWSGAGERRMVVVPMDGDEKPWTLDRDTVKDVVVPGIRLHGVVAFSNSAIVSAGSSRQRIYWHREGKSRDRHQWVQVTETGRYVIDGVTPGRYSLEGDPHTLDDRRGMPAVIDITDTRSDVEFDLTASRR